MFELDINALVFCAYSCGVLVCTGILGIIADWIVGKADKSNRR